MLAGAGLGESLGEGMLFHSIHWGLNTRLIPEHTEQHRPWSLYSRCTSGRRDMTEYGVTDRTEVLRWSGSPQKACGKASKSR